MKQNRIERMFRDIYSFYEK